MADLVDVIDLMAQLTADAVYPNGTSQPSVAGIDVRIYPNEPNPEQLDLDLAGKALIGGVVVPRGRGLCAHVSVVAPANAAVKPYQILNETYVINPPVLGLAVSISGNTLTATGTPEPGEFLCVVADNKYISSHSGSSASVILSAIAAELEAYYGGVTATSSTLTIPTAAHLAARQGAPATLGRVTHRQRQQVTVTVWAPNPDIRTALAEPIDNMIKQSLRYQLPDTSYVLITYNRTAQPNNLQDYSAYRRDLIFDVEYATVEQFTGYPVTAVSATLGPIDTVFQNFPSLSGAA